MLSHQLPKLILVVKFPDGIEFARSQAQSAFDPLRHRELGDSTH
jgi:hypothetical protein